MRPSWKTGVSFGLTSGVITTLGLMVGLYSGTHSRTVVIGGILQSNPFYVPPQQFLRELRERRKGG